jgi:hypothetical protein
MVGINRLIETYYSEKEFLESHKLPKRTHGK